MGNNWKPDHLETWYIKHETSLCMLQNTLIPCQASDLLDEGCKLVPSNKNKIPVTLKSVA